VRVETVTFKAKAEESPVHRESPSPDATTKTRKRKKAETPTSELAEAS
jgi:hypothetical protein